MPNTPILPWKTLCRMVLAALLSWGALDSRVSAEEPGERLFETEIRPLLAEHCRRCHGSVKQSGGLRVDSREALLQGGDRGPALVPGDASASLLLQAVRRQDGLEMPPDEELSKQQVAALEAWIRAGAPWPAAAPPATSQDVDSHWAFQPVREPSLPAVHDPDWVRTPVDAFVLARLEQAGLRPAEEADRRTLIRRVTYALTGLPPDEDQVRQFVADPDPQAYARLVEQLLSSPQYGEQWARHWLDVARYSDTKGYVYAREERFWVHAWTYRDWLVAALNDDMPYDRFLLLQLAADQVQDARPHDLAAMGFLTVGRRFLGVKHHIIDDRIDVVCRGTMGLTVACARCHDHKYDPIPTTDYYSLYGVFDSSAEQLMPLDRAVGDEAFRAELARREEGLRSRLAQRRQEAADAVRGRVADYLFAQSELHKYPADGFDQVFAKTDILPAFVRRWEERLRQAASTNDSIFAAWRKFSSVPGPSFASQAVAVTREIQQDQAIHPAVREAFAEPPESLREVADRYGALLARIDEAWKQACQSASEAGQQPPAGLADLHDEQLRSWLYGPQAPCEVPDLAVVHIESYFDTGTIDELWKLQGELDRLLIQSPHEVPCALALVDRPVPREPHVFVRGNSLQQGPQVPRHFLSLLSPDGPRPFQHGSGRLELARAIVSPSNPLTARVAVNRVWSHHFGRGLVETASDFGLRAQRPSHPELLDYLAAQFVARGWSLKQLHRWIVLSSTFRQASSRQEDSVAEQARQQDPGNRLLWRMNPRRLSFEELRDSLLSVTGSLDSRVGGKPVPLFAPPYSQRRTLYGLVDRQFLPGTLRIFDFANPDLHVPRRSETTVPQQALFFLNDPQMLRHVRALAETLSESDELPESDERQRIAWLFRRTLQREPSPIELTDAQQFLASVREAPEQVPPVTAADWSYGFGEYDETSQRLAGFTALPHFTGAAWQGGSAWPDPALGWVQLTAEGGHPGNDRQHAAVRRWTAPRPATLAIHSQLKHEPEAGDGIRAFIVSSRSGLLQAATAHQQQLTLNVERIEVDAGETIDFVVDIGDVLNSDQYLWSVTLEDQNVTANRWNSPTDFPLRWVPMLTAWEQLAQVLLCTNEFLFVD